MSCVLCPILPQPFSFAFCAQRAVEHIFLCKTTLELSGQGREGRVKLSRDFLDDVRDNRTPPGSRYSQELHAKLTDALRQVIESNGLISFSEKALKYELLQFIYNESKERQHVEKYNTVGRNGPGDFERWLGITLTENEKETLI